MKKHVYAIATLAVFATLAGCNRASNNATVSPPETEIVEVNSAADVATAEANDESTTFDPTVMTLSLAELVGNSSGDPIAIEPDDTVQSVLTRLSKP